MRASLRAVAVMACGAPRCAFFRRRNAPRALSERCSALAARRNAAAARLALGLVFELMTLPSVMRLFGLSPNQKAKWPALSHFRYFRANLTDDFQCCEPVHAVDPGQVHPRHPVQVALDIEAERVSPIAFLPLGAGGASSLRSSNRSSLVSRAAVKWAMWAGLSSGCGCRRSGEMFA